MIANVIKQFAPDYRKTYCEDICPYRDGCEIYGKDKV